MGGSGSSGGRVPAGPRGRETDPCDLRFQTALFSPIPSVVDELSVGDRLLVRLIGQGQPQSVAALTHDSQQVAGTIIAVEQFADLINCLALHDYEAEVTAISESNVTVVVERVQQ